MCLYVGNTLTCTCDLWNVTCRRQLFLLLVVLVFTVHRIEGDREGGWPGRKGDGSCMRGRSRGGGKWDK